MWRPDDTGPKAQPKTGAIIRSALSLIAATLLVGCSTAATIAPTQAVPDASGSGVARSAAPTSATCPATSSPAPAPPGGTGTYARTTPEGIAGASSTLTLCPDGVYTLDVGVTGRWAYANGEMTFTETSSTACAGMPGIYNWAFEGTQLSLTIASDHCGIRRLDYPAAPWTKAQ